MNAPNRLTTLVRLTRITLLVLALFASLATVSAATPNAAQAPLFNVTAPSRVEVGEPITFILTLNRAANVAGYETAVLFDTSVAEFAGLEQQQNDIKAFGRDVSSLAAINLTGGVAVGLYSCPTADCVTRLGARQDHGRGGTVHLARLSLVANQPGILEVAFDATKVVDAAGNPITVRMRQQRIRIQIGDGAGPLYTAPTAMWALATSPTAPTKAPDVTGDGLVTHADVAEIALAWESTRLNGAPCASLPEQFQPTNLDLNLDGCIDVADLQLAAAQYSPGSDAPAGSETIEAGPTFTVNAIADGADASPGNGICATSSGWCTLRAALQESNASAGSNTINFSLPGSGVRTIQLNGSLPTINDTSGPTTINGYSQAGSAQNTAALTSNAVILVQIRGNGPTTFDCLKITSANNVIRGLAIFNCRRAFWVYGNAADNNQFYGNFIGTDAAGTFGIAALADNAHGIHIENSADGTQVGDTTLAGRNVISGNGQSGVGVWHEGTDDTVIVNNILGLNPAATTELPNRRHGIDLNFGTNHSQVGGLGTNERNVASGNDYSGIEISHVETTAYNQVIGNFFGTDVTGNTAPTWAANEYTGVTIEDRASNNNIAFNIISNNTVGGVQLTGLTTSYNQIHDNWVGISSTGTPMGNRGFGVRVDGRYNTIGPNNILAYNVYSGIVIRENDKDFNTFTRNSWFGNTAQGIDLYPAGITFNDNGDGDSGPNQNINFPVLTSATPQQVSGTVCPGCTVEVYIASLGAGKYGQGQTFVGSAVADGSGNFTANVTGVSVGQYVTSLTTDTEGNTSEFSLNRLVSN